MNEPNTILDDFSEKKNEYSRLKTYIVFAFFVAVLIWGLAFFQVQEILQIIPVFERPAAISGIGLLFIGIVSLYKKELNTNYIVAVLISGVVFCSSSVILAFIIDRLGLAAPSLPFYHEIIRLSIISVCYVAFSVVPIEIFLRYKSKYPKL